MQHETLKALVAQYEAGELLTRGVLVVDDEPENLAVLEDFLDDDYVVHRATSGDEALRLVDTVPLDIVLTDQRMPKMTGVELLDVVRQRRPDVAGILVTAFTDLPVLVEAINRARVFRYLRKPWDPGELVGAVAQASEWVYQGRAVARLVDLLARRTEQLGAALSEVQAAQQQVLHLERLGTMGRLAAGVTHDLRNVLQGLTLVEQYLRRGNVPADLLAPLDMGLAAMRNLLETLVTLNQFARGGALSLARDRVDAGAVVRDAVTIMRMDMQYRERRAVVDVQPGLPAVVGDRQKLVQVLVNLIQNAVHATANDDTVTVEAGLAPDGCVVLAVEDQGPGVAPAIRPRLFDAFASSKGTQGMGLGLYMARLIVESHGGTIVHVDPPGGGARFEIRLRPAARADSREEEG